MHEVTVFVGGSLGSDPYSRKTWSGSCANLLTTMKSAGLLDRAVGIDVPPTRKRLLMLRNINISRSAWRLHFFADPAYCRALTSVAAGHDATSPILMQLGSMFSLPDAFPQKICVSYHDGNLIERLKSGFELKGVAGKRIDQALRFEEDVARRMSAVLTFSEYLRQSFIHEYHVPAERVFNIGGGINLASLPEATQPKDYTAHQLLFIGSEFVRKGGPQLLEAFVGVRRRFPGAVLHIAGPRQLDRIPPGVVLHGHLSKEDPTQSRKLEELFQQATLFVLPSLWEPFGIAPLEAMLYRLPCVVTNGWALAESVTDGVNGALVAKGSVADLEEKIVSLLSNPAALERMGERGREQVLARYTWQSVVRRMSAVVARLTQNASSDEANKAGF